LLAGIVKYQYYGYTSSEKINTVIVPGVAARYGLGGHPTSFYAALDLGLVSPHSDIEGTKFESGGLAFGVVMGILFSEDFEIEVGYLRVPVDIKPEYYYYYSSSNTANFGGPIINFKRLFFF